MLDSTLGRLRNFLECMRIVRQHPKDLAWVLGVKLVPELLDTLLRWHTLWFAPGLDDEGRRGALAVIVWWRNIGASITITIIDDLVVHDGGRVVARRSLYSSASESSLV